MKTILLKWVSKYLPDTARTAQTLKADVQRGYSKKQKTSSNS